jgi:chromosome partitioning protein
VILRLPDGRNKGLTFGLKLGDSSNECEDLPRIASGNLQRKECMATTICMINQKGGCGKSSTCFHLAGAFAASGLRVLLVDNDPQGSLSQGFFGSTIVEELTVNRTMAAAFSDFAISPSSVIAATGVNGIDICPANHLLGKYNTPCPEETGMEQFAYQQFLDEVSDFNIVLIDCPPNLYRCSWTAMIASDFVVIPVPPEDFGTQGLRSVHQAIENARLLNPALQLLGHLVTRSDRRLLVHRAYESKLRTLYGDAVMATVIPEASAFKVSLACRRPVEFHSAKSRAADLTRQLSREILDRIGVKNKQRNVA